MATSGTQDHKAKKRTGKSQSSAERRGSNPAKRATKVKKTGGTKSRKAIY